MSNSRHLPWVVALMICFIPASAYAQVGWWDWLDKLSGPGPFSGGPTLHTRIACQVENDSGQRATWTGISFDRDSDGWQCLTKATSDGRDLVRSYVEVRVGWNKTKEQALFSDAPGEAIGVLTAQSVTAMFMRQVDPSLAVGIGGGWLRFSFESDLDTRSPSRFVFIPFSVKFLPLTLAAPDDAPWGRFLSVGVEVVRLYGDLMAADFYPNSSSSFQTPGDFVTSVHFSADLLSLWSR